MYLLKISRRLTDFLQIELYRLQILTFKNRRRLKLLLFHGIITLKQLNKADKEEDDRIKKII
jgi:hypothetical protein